MSSHSTTSSLAPRIRRIPTRAKKPLRTPPYPGLNLDLGDHTLLGGPHGYCTNSDWKEWHSVVRSLRMVLRERNCTAPIPRCRDPELVEVWLEVNFLIGRPEDFPDGYPSGTRGTVTMINGAVPREESCQALRGQGGRA